MKKIKTIYWDANCHIALLNKEATTEPQYLAALEETYEDMLFGKVHILTCTLILAEVFQEEQHRNICEKLIGCPHYSMIETVSSIYALAGELRLKCAKVNQKLKTPDAIHIASGSLAKADEIWTTDEQLINKGKAELLVDTPIVYPYIQEPRLVFE